MTKTPIRRALLSVSDKTDIVRLARALASADVELVSTGGTAQALKEAGLACRDVSQLTQFPEMMDGRVKTLHPAIHGALLAKRDDENHLAAMREHDIAPIDLLVVNLYPFEQVLERGGDVESFIENIDVGGPAMIRAAAKNHQSVAVVVEPADYETIIAAIENGGSERALRQALAQKAFARVAAYDAAISNWMAGAFAIKQEARDWLAFGGKRKGVLRYGENPHQAAGFYTTPPRAGLAGAVQVQGKALSYNNINDADAACALVRELGTGNGMGKDKDKAAIAIVKHANPCGVAIGDNLAHAFARALACDPVSAFGGIVACNRALDEEAANAICDIFTEVIVAPAASEAAKEIIAKKKNLRLLLLEDEQENGSENIPHIRSVAGGFLFQNLDDGQVEARDIKCVSKREPSPQEIADLHIAWKIAKHVKSNAIVYVKEGASVGIGAGQMSRLDSATIAAHKAKLAGKTTPLTQGSVAASDAFFPFADGVHAIAAAGATAIIQPGGSVRDAEVTAAADEAGLAMLFTGMRHFKH